MGLLAVERRCGVSGSAWLRSEDRITDTIAGEAGGTSCPCSRDIMHNCMRCACFLAISCPEERPVFSPVVCKGCVIVRKHARVFRHVIDSGSQHVCGCYPECCFQSVFPERCMQTEGLTYIYILYIYSLLRTSMIYNQRCVYVMYHLI